MFYYKEKLNKEDEQKISDIIQNLSDEFGDFYLTKNNMRLYIRENISLLFESLNKGDKTVYNENGIILTTGFSDNYNRNYIKILAKNNDTASKLIKVLLLNLKDVDLYCKIKRNNPVRYMLYSHNFKFYKGRGKEMLLLRKIYKDKEK